MTEVQTENCKRHTHITIKIIDERISKIENDTTQNQIFNSHDAQYFKSTQQKIRLLTMVNDEHLIPPTNANPNHISLCH